MEALILAAGLGTRMGNTELPKSLLKVAGRPLIERHILLLKRYGIQDFVIVVNPKHIDTFKDFFESRKLEVNFRFVLNEHPEKGNGYSFLLGLSEIKEESFVLVMADHIFEEKFIEEALGKKGLIVDRVGLYIDKNEATKVKLEGKKVKEIGKKLPDYDGFDTGFFILEKSMFQKEKLSELFEREKLEMSDVVKEFELPGDEVSGRLWMDVDTPNELKEATKILIKNSIKDSEDGVVSRLLNRHISTQISAILIDKITPTQATVLSWAVGMISSLLCLLSPVWGVILYQISSILDGVDGEIARASLNVSEIGGWTDSVLDRITDSAVIAALSTHLVPSVGNILLALWMLFSSFMVSYISERYRGATSRSFYKDFPEAMRIPGKRDERIFMIMLFTILFGVKWCFLLVSTVVTLRIAFSLKLAYEKLVKALLCLLLIVGVSWGGECLFVFRPEFKAYISKQISEKSDILVVIHGGLSSAEKAYKMCTKYAEIFPELVIVSLDFSPAPIGTKEIAEAVSLIEWLKTTNPKRIALLGRSFGGFIALSAAEKQPVDQLILISAPVDMNRMFNYVNQNPEIFKNWLEAIKFTENYCEKKKINKKTYISQISPINNIQNLKATKVMILHGTKDKIVPVNQTLLLIEKLLKTNLLFEAHIIPAGHDIDVKQPKIQNLIRNFLF